LVTSVHFSAREFRVTMADVLRCLALPGLALLLCPQGTESTRQFHFPSQPVESASTLAADTSSDKVVTKPSNLLDEAAKEDVESEWMVVFKTDATVADIDTFCDKAPHGCHERSDPTNGAAGYVQFKANNQQKEDLIKDVSYVEFVEKDDELEEIPTTPERTPSEENQKWGLNRIGAPDRPRMGKGVNIYIFDSGIRSTHEEFGGRVVPHIDWTLGSAKLGRGALCGDQTDCAVDQNGHGTHVAGTAAGATFGVAPAATLRSVKVLTDQGRGALSWTFTALDYVSKEGPRPAVASMSLGIGRVVKLANTFIDRAVENGVVVVVAAGNDDSDACKTTPAFVPAAITVGATDLADKKSSFSNYGTCTDVWAPGTAIESASVKADAELATLSGTSMAAPHVSGAAALVLQASPSIGASGVRDVLYGAATEDKITGLKEGDTNKLLNVAAPLGGGATSSGVSFLCMSVIAFLAMLSS